ncbi:hypothetical protein CDL12_26903 [Handroanthus impetiginosus]|uniref:Uncharacterized protein n=1 Tax=Handroanthus impetiginosus TaxID=429701 RepID=A0A2G9G631_9LAMI|nr:hypothetical protein CDL12_26903 [Handroanthus impetiginosus]
MERLFSKKLQNLNRKNIVNKLNELANKDSTKDIDDFYEEVCRGRRKSEEIPRRLHCWVDAQKLIEFFRLYRWGECKLPNKVHDAEDRLKSITAEMVFQFNPTSPELCLLNQDSAVAAIVRAKDQEIKELKKRVFELNPTSQELYLLNLDSAVAAIVRAKDQEIKELKKRVAELETAANKDLCVVALAKADVAATKKQRDHGAACEERDDNDGEEKERKDEEEEDEEDKEMDEERKDDEDEEEEEEEKAEQDEQKKEKIKEGQDDKKGKKEDCEDEEEKEKEGEKEDGEYEEGKEKEGEKEKERKDGDNDEKHDHDADNEHNDMNEENQTKHRAGQVSCHHEVEMNKKLEVISRKLDFGQDVDFGEWDYEVVRTLSSIVDGVQNRDELIEKQKLKDLDSPLSTTLANRAKQRNEESDYGEEKKTIPEQEKAGLKKKKMVRLEVECEGF